MIRAILLIFTLYILMSWGYKSWNADMPHKRLDLKEEHLSILAFTCLIFIFTTLVHFLY